MFVGKARSLTRKHKTRVERHARDKHSSLLQKFVNYGQKSFATSAAGRRQKRRKNTHPDAQRPGTETIKPLQPVIYNFAQ